MVMLEVEHDACMSFKYFLVFVKVEAKVACEARVALLIFPNDITCRGCVRFWDNLPVENLPLACALWWLGFSGENKLRPCLKKAHVIAQTEQLESRIWLPLASTRFDPVGL